MLTWKTPAPNRLLKAVQAKCSTQYTTKELRWAIEHNRCFVNNQLERFCSARLKKGDTLSIFVEKPPKLTFEQARVVHEDPDLLIYNKPPYFSTEMLAKQFNLLPAHRLDRDTSGLILFAKNLKMQKSLETLFLKHQIQKHYLAIVDGRAKKEGSVSGNMRVICKMQGAVIWGMGKKGIRSQTHWRCLNHYKESSLIQCQPTTGRTHQIRVHLNHIGHPIVGDPIYGPKNRSKGVFRPLLHAHELQFIHPISGKECHRQASPPPDFSCFLP